MKKLASAIIAEKIILIDREGATAAAEIVALREKRREAVRSGDDAGADKIERELLTADRLMTMRGERREILCEEQIAAERRETVSEFERRSGAAQKHNEALAVRIKTEGRRLSEQMMALMRDVAAADEETDTINRLVPDGMHGIASANYLARGKAALQRIDLKEEIVDLWCFESTGNLCEQDRVVVSANNADVGHIEPSATELHPRHMPVVKRRFRSISYHPAEQMHFVEPLVAGLRLPNFEGAGSWFDGAIATPLVLPEAQSSKDKPASRPVQTELMLIDEPMPQPKGIMQRLADSLAGN